MSSTKHSASSLDRFFAPGEWTDGSVQLSPDEVHHLTRVLRAQQGDLIEVFDGAGRHATARIENISKRDVNLQLVGDLVVQPAIAPAIILAVASPKGERLKWLVEKCTELGVDTLVPLRTERSVVEPGDSKLHKLDQTVIAACKQSRRDRLMAISPIQGLSEFLRATAQRHILYGDAGGLPPQQMVVQFQALAALSGEPRNVAIVVGPEGGLTSDETGLLRRSGAYGAVIGGNILRVETAAIALSAVVLSLFGTRTV